MAKIKLLTFLTEKADAILKKKQKNKKIDTEIPASKEADLTPMELLKHGHIDKEEYRNLRDTKKLIADIKKYKLPAKYKDFDIEPTARAKKQAMANTKAKKAYKVRLKKEEAALLNFEPDIKKLLGTKKYNKLVKEMFDKRYDREITPKDYQRTEEAEKIMKQVGKGSGLLDTPRTVHARGGLVHLTGKAHGFPKGKK